MSRRAPISAEIGVLSVLLAWLIGLPVGMLSALRPRSVIDGIASSSYRSKLLAVPGFWTGNVDRCCTDLRGSDTRPPVPSRTCGRTHGSTSRLSSGPAVVLGVGQAAIIARLLRSSLFEVLHEDYVRTARAKGLNERLVLVRHALRNSLLPVLTLSGLLLAFLLGGSVAVEQAFGTPGLGNVHGEGGSRTGYQDCAEPDAFLCRYIHHSEPGCGRPLWVARPTDTARVAGASIEVGVKER